MWPFSKKSSSRNVVLIDIDLGGVGGALICIPEVGKPIVCATVRTSLEKWRAATPEESMLAALKETGDRLIREGAPTLRRRAGSAAIDKVILNIGCPWQTTQVRVERIRPGKSFTFTKDMLDELLAKQQTSDEHYTSEQTVIATLLNGYAVAEPFGKRADRAELVILSASVQNDISTRIESLLRALFHTRNIFLTTFAAASYTVLRHLYPHEKDFLILDVSDGCTDVVSIKHGRLVDAGAVACGTDALLDKTKDAWLSSFSDLLNEFAVRNALPRTIFLIAGNETRGFLTEALGAPFLRKLWLSDEPVSVVPVLQQQFAPFLTYSENANTDVLLALLALYAAEEAA